MQGTSEWMPPSYLPRLPATTHLETCVASLSVVALRQAGSVVG